MSARLARLAHRFLRIAAACAGIATAGVAIAGQPSGKYLDGKASRVGVILLHGHHLDVDSWVVGPLRVAINKRLGFHTLSLDYPQTRAKSGAAELGNFPAAYEDIDQAIAFLTKEKGVTRIYLMGHSLGTRMTTSYLATHAAPEVRGYIGVGIYGGTERGCKGERARTLSSWCNLRTILDRDPAFPVIDVVAMATPRDVSFADERSQFVSKTYQQVRIEGADHKFESKESEMVDAVVGWLGRQEPERASQR